MHESVGNAGTDSLNIALATLAVGHGKATAIPVGETGISRHIGIDFGQIDIRGIGQGLLVGTMPANDEHGRACVRQGQGLLHGGDDDHPIGHVQLLRGDDHMLTVGQWPVKGLPGVAPHDDAVATGECLEILEIGREMPGQATITANHAIGGNGGHQGHAGGRGRLGFWHGCGTFVTSWNRKDAGEPQWIPSTGDNTALPPLPVPALAVTIPQSFIDDLLERTDIVDVVGRYVTLKKGGVNLMGLCPFHDEKSPSFTVSPSKQFFHCFGCGKNGDALRFLMDYTNVGFVDAVEDLAQRAGMQVPRENISPQEEARRQQAKETRLTLTELNAKAMQAYKQHLRHSASTIQYLKKRGVSGELAARYALGYAPPGEHALASVFPDYADPRLEECGLVIFREETHRRYDRFRDRLMFPIRNLRGECIGFGGRILGDGQPKYLNSPETPLFHKGRELYGLYEGKRAIAQAGYALVCEGYMDVIALAQWGFGQAVATLGTACGPAHVQLLFRHTDRIVFAFDGDNAGRNAARKALECALPLITDTRTVTFLFLPKEHDPDSFIRDHGPEAFASQVQQAMPMSQYLLEVARQDCDLSTPEGRARMSHQARPLWQLLPHNALKIQIFDAIAQQAQMAPASLQQLWHLDAATPAPAATSPPNESWASEAPPDAQWLHEDFPASPDPMPAADWPPFAAPPHAAPHASASGYATGKTPPPRYPRPPARGHAPAHGLNRPRPISRDEQALCILLAHTALLDALSEKDLHILRKLTAPTGQIFGWLEEQHMQHGAQTWPQLASALAETAHHSSIQRLAARIEFIGQNTLDDAALELQSTLNGIIDTQLTEQIERLQQEFVHNPEARQQLQSLLRQRAAMKSGHTAPP